MSLLQEIADRTNRVVRCTEILLAKVEPLNELSKEARRFLVRGLWHAGQVTACIRNNVDYGSHIDDMETNLEVAHKLLAELRRGKWCTD